MGNKHTISSKKHDEDAVRPEDSDEDEWSDAQDEAGRRRDWDGGDPNPRPARRSREPQPPSKHDYDLAGYNADLFRDDPDPEYHKYHGVVTPLPDRVERGVVANLPPGHRQQPTEATHPYMEQHKYPERRAGIDRADWGGQLPEGVVVDGDHRHGERHFWRSAAPVLVQAISLGAHALHFRGPDAEFGDDDDVGDDVHSRPPPGHVVVTNSTSWTLTQIGTVRKLMAGVIDIHVDFVHDVHRIPQWFWKLPLRSLRFTRCRTLTQLWTHARFEETLEVLEVLHCNRFTTIPRELNECRKLTHFSLVQDTWPSRLVHHRNPRQHDIVSDDEDEDEVREDTVYMDDHHMGEHHSRSDYDDPHKKTWRQVRDFRALTKMPALYELVLDPNPDRLTLQGVVA